MSFNIGFTRLLAFLKLGALVRLRGFLPALGQQYAAFSQSIHRGHVALEMLLSGKRTRSVLPLLLLLLLISKWCMQHDCSVGDRRLLLSRQRYWL